MEEPVTREWLTMKLAARRVKLGYDIIKDACKRFADTGGAEGLRSFQREAGARRRIRIEDLDAWMMGSGTGAESEDLAGTQERGQSGDAGASGTTHPPTPVSAVDDDES